MAALSTTANAALLKYLNGLPIEIAYAPIHIENGKLSLDKKQIFDQLYQVGQPISYAAMAVHHILESDLLWRVLFRIVDYFYHCA